MKQNQKFTLGAVAVALVLGGYMYFVESKQQAPTDTKDVQVWSLSENQAKDLKTLDVTADSKQAKYVRDGDKWHLASEPKRDLDSSWDTAYNNLKTLMASSKVEEKSKDLSKYGLNKPSGTLHWGDPKDGYGLEIGDKSPVGDTYFVHSDKDDTVYTVSSWKVDGWKQLAAKPPLVPLPSPTPKPTPTPAASAKPGASPAPAASPAAKGTSAPASPAPAKK